MLENEPYYGQVQLGTAVLTVSACDFVVYGKESLTIIKVPRDDAFISDVPPKACSFLMKNTSCIQGDCCLDL